MPAQWSGGGQFVDGETEDYLLRVDPASTDVGSAAIGSAFELEHVEPNPSSDRTGVVFSMREGGWVRIRVVDLAGRAVATMLDANLGPGLHTVTWNGLASDGRRVGPGVYFVRAEHRGTVRSQKLIREYWSNRGRRRIPALISRRAERRDSRLQARKDFVMEFQQDAKVHSSDGRELGTISRVVVDPATKRVTHVVMRSGLLGAELVFDTDLVAESSRELVRLRRTADELKALPAFEVERYVPADTEGPNVSGTLPAMYWYPVTPLTDGFGAALVPPHEFPVVERNIPKHTVPMREGARVIASDGRHVGHVHEVIVDRASKRITHFVITKGLVLKEHKLVPTSWIKEITEDEVRLAVGTGVLHALREYQPT